jgi:uncharacterized protein YceK
MSLRSECWIFLVALVMGLFACGCSTICYRTQEELEEVYGGTKASIEWWEEVGAESGMMPEEMIPGWTLDLVLSTLTDTICLPYDIYSVRSNNRFANNLLENPREPVGESAESQP